MLADAKADLLLYGNAERAVVEVAHRLAAGEAPRALDDIRGVALFRKVPEDYTELHADDLEVGPDGAGGDGAPGEQSAAPGRHHQYVEVRLLLQHLSRHGSLAGHDVDVVER